MKIFKKDQTINITINSNEKNVKTKTISAIVENKDEKNIEKLKKEIETKIVKSLENTQSKKSIYLQFRVSANKRVGSIKFKTDKTIDEVYNYFQSVSE